MIDNTSGKDKSQEYRVGLSADEITEIKLRIDERVLSTIAKYVIGGYTAKQLQTLPKDFKIENGQLINVDDLKSNLLVAIDDNVGKDVAKKLLVASD